MSKTEDRTLPIGGRPVAGATNAAPQVSLVVFHRDGAKVATLTPGGAAVVGRMYPADLVVEDRSLSRQHARFAFDATSGAVTVEDLGSTNGTFVNGARVTTRTGVSPGDDVKLGELAVAVHTQRARGEEPPRGIGSHDRFVAQLGEELTRARTFKRPLSVLMVQNKAGGERAHVSRWTPGLLAALRPVDHAALYGPDTALIALVETAPADATLVAQSMVRQGGAVAGALRAAVASFPEDGASVDELLASVRGALQRASASELVVLAARVSAAAGAGGEAGSAGGAGSAAGEVPGGVVIQSPAMRELYETVARVASSMIPVLITGETGSGKEVVARALHEGSPRGGYGGLRPPPGGAAPRSPKPMRSINCGAIPATLLEGTLFGHEKGAFTGADRTSKGLFEQAHGGTVFLDEIGELSAPAQAALLRVLETRKLTRVGGDREIEVDVRVLAATHRDLEALAEAGTFRADLLYRLNAMTLRVPPLRERPEDLRALFDAFLAEANRVHGRAVTRIEPRAWARLAQHRWPGNVRELRNVVDRAVVIARGDVITEEELPERLRAATSGPTSAMSAVGGAGSGSVAPPQPASKVPPAPAVPAFGAPDHAAGAAAAAGSAAADEGEGLEYKERVRAHMERYETELIVEALKRFNGNQTEAAKALQMPVRTLAHKIQMYGIKKTFEK